MPVFDYQDEKNTQLIKDALIIDGVFFGAAASRHFSFTGEGGWEILDGSALNNNNCVNPYGAFYGESPLFSSAECNVLGKYDAQGNLVNIGISFWGTGTYAGASIFGKLFDTALDATSDVFSALFDGYADNYVLNAHGKLMNAVADFARANGLSGSDVIISGHSLGGLAVNSMATLSSDGAWNGFFQDASYVAFASPTQNLSSDKVLNIGYENDPVFRVLNGDNITLETPFSHDSPRETCTNNVVSFDEYHANKFGLMSIANFASWGAHAGAGYTDGVLRIMDSGIYDFTHQNSTIIVSNLAEVHRAKMWVSDLNKSIPHTGSTFIVGTESNDLLMGGAGNDYLWGGAGNDTFKDHSGYNIVYGGEGTNTFITESNLANLSFSHDTDGNLYFKYLTGDITKAQDIAYINAEYTKYGLFGVKYSVKDTYSVTDYGLEGKHNAWSYANSYYANTENSFTVSAADNGCWLFSGDRDSTVSIAGNSNSFVSGGGSDVIHLYGSDNSMLFYGDFGNDTIFNLSRSDSLVFMANQYIEDNDSYLNHLSYIDNDALLTFGDSSVTLVGVNADMLSEMHIAVA